MEVVGAVAEGGAVVTALASRVLSITSTMRLRVELRALAMITGFRSSVLLFDARFELGGCIPLIDLASCLRFRSWLLPASLPVVIEWAEPIEMSCCGIGWGRTVGGREEDGGGFELPEEEEALRSGGRRDDTTEGVPLNEEVTRIGGMRVGDIVDAWSAGVLAMGESSEGPTQSSAPSSSASTALRICVADWDDELPGSKAWVPRGWVPGIKACILR